MSQAIVICPQNVWGHEWETYGMGEGGTWDEPQPGYTSYQQCRWCQQPRVIHQWTDTKTTEASQL